MITHKKTYSLILAVFTLMITISTLALAQTNSKLPPRNISWDMENPASFNITIPSKGVYIFALLFSSESTTDLKKILGDGSYKFLSNDKRLIPGKDGSLNELNNQANQGLIVRRPANPGTTIPVSIGISMINKENSQVLNKTVETQGVSGYLPGGTFRTIVEKTLEPGEYMIKASSVVKIPEELHVSLIVLPPQRY